jgi:phage N-6-adenine-methyltransferase
MDQETTRSAPRPKPVKHSPERDERGTPDSLFAELDREFGFTLDAAALPHNAKLPRFCAPDGTYETAFDGKLVKVSDEHGLLAPWAGERVFLNPPFSDIAAWVVKAAARVADVAVLLLPANRTDQAWWHDFIEPFRDIPGSGVRTRFIRGRTRFSSAHGYTENQPPFGCVLVIFEGRKG